MSKKAARTIRRSAPESRLHERAQPRRRLPASTRQPAAAPSPRTTTTSRTPSSPATASRATMASRSRSNEEADHQSHLHQKRDNAHHQLLPSPPRPARGARREGRARRRTSTTSPATKPEREEGEDKPEADVADTAIGDATGNHTHLTTTNQRTAGAEAPPHLAAPRTAAGGRGEQQIRRRRPRPRVASFPPRVTVAGERGVKVAE